MRARRPYFLSKSVLHHRTSLSFSGGGLRRRILATMDKSRDEVPGGAGGGGMQAGAVGAMGKRKRISEETWALAEAAYFSGEAAAVVAQRYGMAMSTLYVRVAGRGKRARRATPERLAQDRARRAEALSRVERMTLAMVEAGRTIVGVGETLIRSSGVREAASVRGYGAMAKRRHHSQDIWDAARRDYVEGGFTAGEIAGRYDMSASTIRTKASTEGWTKRRRIAPEPLLAPDAADEIDADGVSQWAQIARPSQRAPEGAWSTWLFQGGRGAGKTRAGAEWMAQMAMDHPRGRFALIGPTQADVREVMIEGVSGLRNLPGRMRPKFEQSRRRLTWDNGAVAYAFSAEEPERLRGPQFMAAWADEFCIWRKPAETLAILRMGLRLGEEPRLVVTTTPRPVPALRALRAEAGCVMTHAGTAENADHLPPSFLDGLHALYGGTRLAAQELDGVLVDGDGALWRAEEIAGARAEAPAVLERVVVGVDPPATTGGVCGIVVAGRVGTMAFVLADCSVQGLSPLGWGERVARTAQRFGAHEIVAECNQGGDMVGSTLQVAGAGCRVTLVRAGVSKRGRAEPVAALYEQKRVKHCGVFALLEEELMALGAEEGGAKDRGEGRLDRADALVWAVHALLLGPRRATPRVGVV
jgi:phage terminase large subunit-like protein/transposase-like protein